MVQRENSPEGTSKYIASLRTIIATALLLMGGSFAAGSAFDNQIQQIFTVAPAERESLRAELDSLATLHVQDVLAIRETLHLLVEMNAAVWCSVEDRGAAQACTQYNVDGRIDSILRQLNHAPRGF